MAFVIAAVSTAIEVGTVAAIATAATQVGIAMTVVGTITKSKELTKIGGVLSLAGGATSLANAAGMFGEVAAGTAGAASGAGTAAGAASEGASELSGGSLWSDAASQATADQYASAAADVANDVSTKGFEGAATSAANAPIGASTGLGAASDGLKTSYDLTNAANPAQAAGSNGSTIGAGATGFTPPTPEITGVADATQQVAQQAPSTGLVNNATSMQVGSDVSALPAAQATAAIPKPGLFDDPKAWFKGLTPDQQSRVSTALLQTGGQAIGGLFQGWTAEQKLALEKEAQNLQEQKYQQGLKTASAMPVVAFKPVGLISGATKG